MPINQSVNDSKFNMWRACVAVVHLDQVVTPEERKWVEEKLRILPLTNDQRLILIRDLEIGNNFQECFNKITDKVDKAFLLNTLRVIAHLDHSFSQVEKDAFKKIESLIMRDLNITEITKQVELLGLQSAKKPSDKKSVFESLTDAFDNLINS
jgi:hypothetical protein